MNFFYSRMKNRTLVKNYLIGLCFLVLIVLPTKGFTASNDWNQCADENGICSFLGTKLVRYGANNVWTYQEHTDSVLCDNTTFGDPIGGIVKSCFIGSFQKANGDSPCASGYSLVSPDEARANQNDICSKLGIWDIVRLSGGGSMDGSGYGCGIRNYDTRTLGGSVCKKVESFTPRLGDGAEFCEVYGETLTSFLVANANQQAACNTLWTWDIVRLADKGSMDGPGYGCGTREYDSRELGQSLCAQYDIQKVSGDTSCPVGTSLATPTGARNNQAQACAVLETWDIVRLAGGGSMDGSGYGCGVRENDTRSLGASLCNTK